LRICDRSALTFCPRSWIREGKSGAAPRCPARVGGFSTMAFKRCVVCGNLFDARRNAKTCSPEHSRQRVKATPRDWKHDRSQQNKPRARTCVVCGKTFYTTTATKTCSPEHREEHLRQVRRAAVRRYQASAKAQETRCRYEQSQERREYRQEYYQSNLYREARRRYEQSEKGQETLRGRSKKPGGSQRGG